MLNYSHSKRDLNCIIVQKILNNSNLGDDIFEDSLEKNNIIALADERVGKECEEEESYLYSNRNHRSQKMITEFTITLTVIEIMAK